MTPLCELAMKYGTDKCPQHRGLRPGHSYTPFYHELFSPIRESVRTLLEIGIETGASLRMWRDYFPNAQIVGVDNNPKCAVHENRINSICCDAQELMRDYGFEEELNIVIDDGSHQVDDQIVTARSILPFMDKGFYVIEDVQLDAVEPILTMLGSCEVYQFDTQFGTQDDRLIVVRP